MKFKKTIIVTLFLFLLSTSILGASDNIVSYLFKGKLVINNEIVDLKKEIFNINGSVYVPLRALAEETHGFISYDHNDQTIYVEQTNTSTKKSTINEQDKNDVFTLAAFSSKQTYSYGEPVEIWARLSNHSEQTLNLSHGFALIEYTITDEEGFSSKDNFGLALYLSSFEPGDELHSNLSQRSLFTYNLNKYGLNDNKDIHAYLNETLRPSVLPRGNYEVKIRAEYWIGDGDNANKQAESLEVSLPLIIE
ncbi:stalk domain-containing protein [Paenibacillus septentrionalis]|uniref:Stalk domain-containing protein n=1 Tax=Paenibacillus septentrionalis TaxID=429342 RepID=A0ABW1VBB9_9BACL